MRRPNGTGSIYRRNDGKQRRHPWMAVVNIGFSDTGQRLKKSIGSFPTRAAAQKALDLYNTRTPAEQRASFVTFGQVWEAVVAERKRLERPVSLPLLSIWKHHAGKLAAMPIADIKTMNLQWVIDTSGLSGIGQAPIVTVYRMIYAYALANDIVMKDYSQFVKTAPKKKSTMHHPFTTEEMRLLWSHAHDDVAKIVLIQCYTGMRPTELSQIYLQNVHLSERYMIGGMKTDAGKNRTIPIADCIADFVTHFCQLSLFAKSDRLITPDMKINLLRQADRADIPRSYARLFARIGIHNHRAHDPRHTFVTMADNYGVPDIFQKLIIGHVSNRDTTKFVYTHKTIPQLIEAVNMLPFGVDMKMTPETLRGSHVVAKW